MKAQILKFFSAIGKRLKPLAPVWRFFAKSGRAIAPPIAKFCKATSKFFAKGTAPNLALVTTLTLLISAAGLGILHTQTASLRAEAREAAFEQALIEVFPEEGYRFEPSAAIGDDTFAVLSGGEVIGFAVRVTFRALGGEVDMLVGVNVFRDVVGTAFIENREIGNLAYITERGIELALALFVGGGSA